MSQEERMTTMLQSTATYICLYMFYNPIVNGLMNEM